MIFAFQNLFIPDTFLKSCLIIFKKPTEKKIIIRLPHLAYFSKKKTFTMSCNMKKPKQNLTSNSKGKEKKEKKPSILCT